MLKIKEYKNNQSYKLKQIKKKEEKMSSNENVECCPEFNPEPWDDKIVEWDNKKFIKDHVFTLFYMPMNFGAIMKKLSTKVENAKADVPDWLCLSDHTSKWNMDVYLAVDKEVPMLKTPL